MTDWIAELSPHDHWNRRVLCAIMGVFSIPKTYLDVGCGTGAMVKLARSMGIEAYGLDLIAHPEDYLITHDLRHPFHFDTAFNLVTCIEVMEHINRGREDVTLDSIVEHMGHKSVLVFSAAGPGQAGSGHVNLRLGKHWRDKFDERGLGFRQDYTRLLQSAFNLMDNPANNWLIGNLQVFDKWGDG